METDDNVLGCKDVSSVSKVIFIYSQRPLRLSFRVLKSVSVVVFFCNRNKLIST